VFTYDGIYKLLNATPFVPFRLHLSDGGYVDVRHRELALALRRYVFVALPDPAAPDAPHDRYTFVWYMHVTRTESLVPGLPPSSSGGTASSPAGAPV
jgi:hypothetical protein